MTQPILNPAIGLDADVRHGLLWVAGGPTGRAAAYRLDSAAPAVPAPGLTLTTIVPSFINDVVSTRDAAYFTNSMVPELYRVPVSRRGGVGEPETVPLSGPAGDFDPGFNLNGIDATRDGKTLIVVNSGKGELYTVDAETGASKLIDLGGGTVPTGDGILLDGRTLYVLQNGNAPRRAQPDRGDPVEPRPDVGADRRHEDERVVRDRDDARQARQPASSPSTPSSRATADRRRARGRPPAHPLNLPRSVVWQRPDRADSKRQNGVSRRARGPGPGGRRRRDGSARPRG